MYMCVSIDLRVNNYKIILGGGIYIMILSGKITFNRSGKKFPVKILFFWVMTKLRHLSGNKAQ